MSALMPSHAPLCGINRPHVRHWSRTNRIDPILELPPVTSDTVPVPPPTRSPEPKVTRYIVIRNDQHDGSSHHGKIFIVAGNRPVPGRAPGKATITFRDHSARPGLAARVAGLSRSPPRKIFQAWSAGTPHSPKYALAPRLPHPARRDRTGPPGDAPFERPTAAPGGQRRHRRPRTATDLLDLRRPIPINPVAESNCHPRILARAEDPFQRNATSPDYTPIDDCGANQDAYAAGHRHRAEKADAE